MNFEGFCKILKSTLNNMANWAFMKEIGKEFARNCEVNGKEPGAYRRN